MAEPLRILLTNDDGIDAAGINALERVFCECEDVELWVVAPDRERSTCGHGMSLSRPVYVSERGLRRIAVDGLPADCVYLAFFGLMPKPPDVVVSGINHGANLGDDVFFSGTVGAAREATMLGVHGVAVSLVDGNDFEAAAKSVCEIALSLAKRQDLPALLLNINYPVGSFSGPQMAKLGKRNYPRVVSERKVPLTGQRYFWLGGPPIEDREIAGSDGWLISRGIASTTLLSLDQTDEPRMAEMDLTPLIQPLEEK
jgi:5'/3'-nucleotidase